MVLWPATAAEHPADPEAKLPGQPPPHKGNAKAKPGPGKAVPEAIRNDGEAARLSMITLASPDFEGSTNYMYRDSRGFVTVGVGKMLTNAAAAAQLPFVGKSDRPATGEEITTAFATVHAMRAGPPAPLFKGKSDVTLPQSAIDDLLALEVHKAVQIGRRVLPDFDHYPVAAQQALIDMAYNLGEGREADPAASRKASGLRQYHTLLTSARKEDWKAAARECYRHGPNQKRNDWTRDKFLEASGSAPPVPSPLRSKRIQ